MSAPVTPIRPLPSSQSLAQRIAELQAEARGLTGGQVDQLLAALDQVATVAADIVEARALHMPGIVDTCRQLSEQAPAAALHINSLRNRG